MLSFEHVRARRDRDQLVLLELSARQRARAVELAAALLAAASSAVGQSRDELERAFSLLELKPSERRLCEGLKKLIEDACEFEQLEGPEPIALRRRLFLAAAEARRRSTLEAPFRREAVLAEQAGALGLSEAVIEQGLYADLRGAHRLIQSPAFGPEALVADYERAQVQALLLRAVRVEAVVHCASPDAYRALFQKLKFRQLLYRLEPLPGGGYRIGIDGPFSLFEAVSKYGLELALMLPALEACDVLELGAEVLWGKNRTPLRFEYRHVTARPDPSAAPLRDDVRVLLEDFQALDTPWRAAPAHAILELPGVGLCIPDLVFEHADGGPPIHVELLGYWSRDAVWRRVELAQHGLPDSVIFAVSSRLRVSEEVLEASDHAALYVYRGKASPRALERKLDALRGRSEPGPRARP